MKKLWIMLAVIALGLAATVAASGCILNRQATPEAADSATEPDAEAAGSIAKAGEALQALGSATLATALIEKLDPVFAGGVWFLVIGAGVFAFGARGVGGSLFVMGGAMVLVGILFGQYPWVALIAFVAVGCFLLWDALTVRDAKGKLAETEKAAEVIIEAVQTAPGGKAVKEAIADKGTLTERLVRAVVDPIKDRLAEAGKI